MCSCEPGCCKVTKSCSKKTFAWCAPVTCVLSLASGIIAIVVVVALLLSFVPFFQTILNLAEIVTIDIQRVEGGASKCDSLAKPSSDYPMHWEPIGKYNFAGITKGCDCGSTQTSGACAGSCSSVAAIKNDTYSSWGTPTTPYTLCRLIFGEKGKSGATFLNNYVDKNGKCKNADKGYNTVCNPDADVAYRYCMPRADLCPVYEIQSVIDSSIDTTKNGESLFQSGSSVTPDPLVYTQVPKGTKFYFS